jgi:hypothetical protein
MSDESHRQGKFNLPPGPNTDWNAFRRGEAERINAERQRAAAEAEQQRQREAQERQRREWERMRQGSGGPRPAYFPRPPVYVPTRRPDPTQRPDPDATYSDYLVGMPIVVGLVVGGVTLLVGGPYVEATLISAAATFAVILSVRLIVPAILAAIVLGALHVFGVDVSFAVDPASRVAHDLYDAVNDRLGR